MESQVKIVFVEEANSRGGGGGFQSPAGPGPVTSSGRSRSPRSNPETDEKDDTEDKVKEAAEAARDLGSAVRSAGSVVAGLTGFGAIFSTVYRVVTAFNELYDAVNRSRDAFRRTPAPAESGPPFVESEAIEPAWWEYMQRSGESRPFRDQFRDDVHRAPENAGLPYEPGIPASGSGGLSVPNKGMIPHAGGGLSVPSAGPVGGQLISASGEVLHEGTTVTTAGITTNGGGAGVAAAEEGVAALGVTAGAVALAFGAVVVAAGVMVYAVKRAADALGQQAEELAGFSVEISTALARSDVRQTQRSVERTSQIGPELADFINLRTRVEDRMYELQTQIYGAMLGAFELIEPAVSLSLNVFDVFLGFQAQILATAETIKDAATGRWDEIDGDLAACAEAAMKTAKATSEILDLEKDKSKRDIEDPFFKEFFQSIDDASADRPRTPVEFDV